MKAHRKFPAIASGLFFITSASAYAQNQDQCYEMVETGIKPGPWEIIKEYVLTLTFTPEAARNKSLLLRLRAEVIGLESRKARLIEIIDAHIAGLFAGANLSTNLSLNQIPQLLADIDRIAGELTKMANDRNMFAAEQAFKDLKINLDLKRMATLCELSHVARSSTPDIERMRSLSQQLKDELRAISDAEEALAKYIRGL